MNSWPRPALAVIAVVATFARLSAAPPPDPAADTAAAVRTAVLQVNDAMTQAANRLDADGFFSYILDTDEGLIVQDGEIFRTRQEALDAVRRGFAGLVKVDRKLEDPHVTVISPDAALLVANGTTAATLADGRTFERRFAVSLLFVRRDGTWKLLHGHYSMPDRR